MANSSQNNVQQLRQRFYRPFDDVKNLYIGHIAEVEGSIQTDNGELIKARFQGEVLLHAQIEGDTILVKQLRRFSLYALPLQSSLDDPIGMLSLTGPLAIKPLEPNPTVTIDDLRLKLHYLALSVQLDPFHENEDAVFPETEELVAKLRLEQIEEADQDQRAVLMEVELADTELVDGKLGIVQAIVIDPIAVPFSQAGRGSPRPEPSNSILSHCGPPSTPCPSPHLETVERRLPIKFVDLSLNPEGKNVVDICNTQLNRVCEVWRNRAALDLTVWPNEEPYTPAPPASLVDGMIDEGTGAEKQQYHSLANEFQENMLWGFRTSTRTEEQWGHVTVYLVDTLVQRPGGGVTYACGTASAFCILELGTAALNPYLLAHELSHMLGLDHPGGSSLDLPPGSWESILEATGGVDPNPSVNTLYNCRIFTIGPPDCNPAIEDCVIPYNPIVKTTTVPDCFNPGPDLVDHLIHDVWNRIETNGDADGGSEHQVPDYSVGSSNYMHVTLEHSVGPRDPINVDLFLVDPGAPPDSAHLAPLKPTSLDPTNHRLTFNPPPTPVSPKTEYLEWFWNEVPPGYPYHSSVIAIAHSVDEPSPFDDPTAVTFGDVSPLLGTSNDIAQRNLHVQEVSPLGNDTSSSSSSASVTSFSSAPESVVSFHSALPWVQMANPFDAAAAAHLEIDTTQASNLVSLSLKVGNEPLREIEVGEPVTVNLAEALRPDERMILRFKAGLLPDVPEGTTFPIDLRFLVDNQRIGGYQYVLRVAPLSETVVQVLDMLFGALRDVAVAFESDAARDLAGALREIVLREKGIEPRRGFWTLIRRVFSASPGDWQADLSNLADPFAALAQSLEAATGSEPERQVVCQHLYELAGRLLTIEDAESPNLFIEQVRDLVDHIYEPAARLARRQQRM